MDLSLIYQFAKEKLQTDRSGHDWLHALRVEKNALKISPSDLSKSQQEMIRAAAWLHDTIDPKLVGSIDTKIDDLNHLLEKAGASQDEKINILESIQNLSYSKNLQQKQSLSVIGQIVQDADRLDAIGAIGIARAFYYGGSQGHLLYNDEKARAVAELTEENYRQPNSVINHFDEKLLQLEKSMNTPAAKKIAQERTAFMKQYLDTFNQEIKD